VVLEAPAPLVAGAHDDSYQATEKYRREAGAAFADCIDRHSSDRTRTLSP
jgi:hypothetical protein